MCVVTAQQAGSASDRLASAVTADARNSNAERTKTNTQHLIIEMRETGKGNHSSPVGNWSEKLI